MSKTCKTHSRETKTEDKNLSSVLIMEMPILPAKFFTFTHEGISMIWMDESPQNPIRGSRGKSN